jgi:uncharacterized protein (DUF1501 family)
MTHAPSSHLAAIQDPQRRRWLRRAMGSGLAALGGVPLASLLLPGGHARAAESRALVCVFLYGGNDGQNCIVPLDASRHAAYAAVRGQLALGQAQLLPLTGSDYGLHPALASLLPLWTAGRLAPVFNVGPLVQPLDKARFRAAAEGSADLPQSLFSHSDQQLLWEDAGGDAQARTGWGGRAMALQGDGGVVISLGSGGRFGVSEREVPLQLPGPGAVFGAMGLQPSELAWAPNLARQQALNAIYAEAALQADGNEQIAALGRVHRSAFQTAQRLGAVVAVTPGAAGSVAAIDQAFAGLTQDGQLRGQLAPQLYQVAKLLAAGGSLGLSRQIYLVEQGGYDTHADQVLPGNPLAGQHADLLADLAAALAAFDAAMQALGLGGQVTVFTQSDFGRTFLPNSSLGTDHAWGNHHLVLGGAVRGGQTWGRYPELTLGGADDVGVDDWELQGRWIPSLSVAQYAATLLSWWGLDDAQLNQVLPHLANFAERRIGFL